MNKVAIIGGGLLGRLLALELFEKNIAVSLFEKGDASGSSSCGYVGLGMISPWSEILHLPQDDFSTLKLGLFSVDLWPQLLKKLKCVQPYLNQGCLLISRPDEKNNIENLKKLIHKSGVKQDFKNLTQSQIVSLEPELNQNFYDGLFFSREGCLDTKSIFTALTNYFNAIKLPVFYNCGECTIKNNEVLVPSLGHFYQKFNFVIDTRGLGTKTVENKLRGVRGETIQVFAPQVNISRLVRVLDTKLPLYILPRGNSIYSLGATCIESECTKPITVRSALEMLSMARYVHEGFMESNILQTETQLRPAFPDNKPKIQLKNNSLSVGGLFRHGIMCAPALAVLCADLVTKNHLHKNTFKEMIYEN